MKKSLAAFAVSFAASISFMPSAAADDERFSLKLASAVAGSTPIVGLGAQAALKQIELISNGAVRIRFFDPGALVPAGEVFDAVAKGSVDAGWHSGGLLKSKIPAATYFSAAPFGAEASELVAWYYHGGGKEKHEEIYAAHNVHPIQCLMLPPEGSGWYRKEINSPADIAGLKIRMAGLGGEVMDKLGASSQMLPAGEVYGALERGVIDAAEISIPLIDEQLGLASVADFYYFPAWHQPATFWELIINLDTWNRMSKVQQAQIETTCTANVTRSLAEGEATQIAPLERLEAAGVQFRSWSPELIETLGTAWKEVAAEYAADDASFNEVKTSFEDFRARYELWRDLAYHR